MKPTLRLLQNLTPHYLQNLVGEAFNNITRSDLYHHRTTSHHRHLHLSSPSKGISKSSTLHVLNHYIIYYLFVYRSYQWNRWFYFLELFPSSTLVEAYSPSVDPDTQSPNSTLGSTLIYTFSSRTLTVPFETRTYVKGSIFSSNLLLSSYFVTPTRDRSILFGQVLVDPSTCLLVFHKLTIQ